MNVPDWQDLDSPLADEKLVWPPGPPRPYGWGRVWLLSFLISGSVIGSVATMLWMKEVLATVPVRQLLTSILLGTGSLTFAGRFLAGRLQPGIDELTAQDLSLWTFWVTLIAIPATLVIIPVLSVLFPSL